MDFEVLGNFDWYNEPLDVKLEKDSFVVFAKPKTDFWQSSQHNFAKDDGHFFYCLKDEDFDFIVKWQMEEMEKFSQCGLMLRFNDKNWLKASIMSEFSHTYDLGSSLTLNGHSDWCSFCIKSETKEIWFRLKKVKNDYILYYSLNGINFVKMRMFYLNDNGQVAVGAYMASPNKEDFSANISEIKFI